jgi:hypothetical protein
MLLLLALLALASGTPLPQSLHLNATTHSTHPSVRPKPFCTPTGPGTCNIAIRYASAKTHEITLYNRFCRVLGGASMPGDFSIKNELPDAVTGNTAFPSFSYRGTKYNDEMAGAGKGLSGSDCIMYGGDENDPGMVNQCAFECGSGPWDEAGGE